MSYSKSHGGDEVLSQNVVRFRQALKWSQQELADRAGLTQSKLARLEKEKAKLDYDETVRMAATLGVSIEDLLSENPNVTPKIVLEKEQQTNDSNPQ